MPLIYSLSLATAGNLTTSGTANTEVDAFFVKAGVRNVGLQAVYVIGKGTQLTSLSGIAFRLIKLTTASTAGTGITPAPKDPGMQAAKATAASRPTIGTTRVNHVVFGCGATSSGGYVAPNVDSPMVLEGGGALSMDMLDVSATVSLTYEFSAEIIE